jgi:hypothetical protein
MAMLLPILAQQADPDLRHPGRGLKRYRSKGEQKVVVEHVTVNEGGQAIVGNVETGGGGSR